MKYHRIIFLQSENDFNGDEKTNPHQIDFFDEGHLTQAEYLAQWDYGDNGETTREPSAGNSDHVHYFRPNKFGKLTPINGRTLKTGDYILTTNSGLRYAGLERIEK